MNATEREEMFRIIRDWLMKQGVPNLAQSIGALRGPLFDDHEIEDTIISVPSSGGSGGVGPQGPVGATGAQGVAGTHGVDGENGDEDPVIPAHLSDLQRQWLQHRLAHPDLLL